jgi:hypothetical protein
MRRSLRAHWRIGAGVGVTLALFVPLLAFGGPAFARTGAAASEYEYSSAAQYQYKLAICHRTHSKKHPWVKISISSRAWPAHERHGDTLAPCPRLKIVKIRHHGNEKQPLHQSTSDKGKSTSKPGKSDKHGNSGEHGSHG